MGGKADREEKVMRRRSPWLRNPLFIVGIGMMLSGLLIQGVGAQLAVVSNVAMSDVKLTSTDPATVSFTLTNIAATPQTFDVWVQIPQRQVVPPDYMSSNNLEQCGYLGLFFYIPVKKALDSKTLGVGASETYSVVLGNLEAGIYQAQLFVWRAGEDVPLMPSSVAFDFAVPEPVVVVVAEPLFQPSMVPSATVTVSPSPQTYNKQLGDTFVASATPSDPQHVTGTWYIKRSYQACEFDAQDPIESWNIYPSDDPLKVEVLLDSEHTQLQFQAVELDAETNILNIRVDCWRKGQWLEGATCAQVEPGIGVFTYYETETVDVSIQADEGWDVSQVRVDGAVRSQTNFNLLMSEYHFVEVDVNQILSTYTLTVEAVPTAGGTVQMFYGDTEHKPSTELSKEFQEDDVVYVNAYANQGYRFGDWLLDGEFLSNEGRVKITMDKDHLLRARFLEEDAPPATDNPPADQPPADGDQPENGVCEGSCDDDMINRVKGLVGGVNPVAGALMVAGGLTTGASFVVRKRRR